MMTPKTEAELAELIKTANAPISVQGGGTRGLSRDASGLTTSALKGVTLYEPGALTLVAQAGTPVHEIERALAAENQRLAFEPMDHRTLLGTSGTPTIGGVIAGNISGPRRIQAGAARDFALGVRYVDGTGTIVKNGGRVMKNVTGYDLVKLLCGSWGTLGVISEVSLKVLPRPETQSTLALRVPGPEEAVAAMSSALGSPFEVSGAAFDAGQVFLRLEGFSDSVTYRGGQLKNLLDRFGEITSLHEGASVDTWSNIRDVTRLGSGDGDIWRVSAKPTDAPAVLEAAGAEESLLDWGGGLLWLRMKSGSDLRARLSGISGHATLVRASDETRVRFGTFHTEHSGIAALSAGLRKRFDPRGVLNPGLMAA